jgi:DNA repair exonuclease SbcCD ATPase subunit
MKGENLSDPELGSNGAGKSTIFDVLHWCLFGSSIRGTKTPQLVPWQNSGTPWAEVTYKTNGQKKRITRSYHPNNLLVTHHGRERGVKQEQLEDIIGFSSDTFQNSIVIGQFSQMFFDLKPRDKLSVFTELLNLDYWLECSQRVTTTLSILREDQLEAEKSLARLEGVRSELKNTLSLTITEADEKAASSSNSYRVLKRKLREIKARKLDLEKRVINLQERIETRTIKDKKLAAKIGKLAKEPDPITATMRDVEGKTKEVQVRIKDLDESLLLLKKSKGICPTCKQKISPQHRRSEQQRIAQKRANYVDRLYNLQVEHEALLKSLDEKLNHLEVIKQKLDHSKSTKLYLSLNKINSDIKESDNELDSTNQQITQLDQLSESYDKKIQKCKRRLTRNRQKMKEARKSLTELNNDMHLARYWVRGFKDIRLFEVDEALTSLQVEVNSYLANLGMADWSVSMEVERETKAGKLSRGFRVMVDPGGENKSDSRPWEAWSGGEGQRLRLAGTLALSNLILRQFNRTCNIQIWDEKLTWLSGSGKDDMLELLQETAKQENKIIFVVDQHTLDFPFDNVINIVKDKEGSHVVPR